MTALLAVMVAQVLSLSRVALMALAAWLAGMVGRRWGRLGFIVAAGLSVVVVAFAEPTIIRQISLDFRLTHTLDRSFDLEEELKTTGKWKDDKWEYIRINNKADFYTLLAYLTQRDAACEVILSSSGLADAKTYGVTNRSACLQISIGAGILSDLLLFLIFAYAFRWLSQRRR